MQLKVMVWALPKPAGPIPRVWYGCDNCGDDATVCAWLPGGERTGCGSSAGVYTALSSPHTSISAVQSHARRNFWPCRGRCRFILGLPQGSPRDSRTPGLRYRHVRHPLWAARRLERSGYVRHDAGAGGGLAAGKAQPGDHCSVLVHRPHDSAADLPDVERHGVGWGRVWHGDGDAGPLAEGYLQTALVLRAVLDGVGGS